MTYFAKAKKHIMVNAMTVDTAFFSTMGVRWQQTPDGWPTLVRSWWCVTKP